jgi:hypothetical protein
MSAHTYSHVFTQAHSIVFMSDNMRNTLREVIRENGISPDKLMQDWGTIERGIQTWLESGHLLPKLRRGGNFRLATQGLASMTTCGWTRIICGSLSPRRSARQATARTGSSCAPETARPGFPDLPTAHFSPPARCPPARQAP